MGRHELTEVHWHQLAPLLPSQKSRVGRPSLRHRRVINGIIWIQATGAPWRDLSAKYGSWLQRHSIRLTIPHKGNECQRGAVDRVQQLTNRLKQTRRIATHYEKRAVNHLAMVTIAAPQLWL